MNRFQRVSDKMVQFLRAPHVLPNIAAKPSDNAPPYNAYMKRLQSNENPAANKRTSFLDRTVARMSNIQLIVAAVVGTVMVLGLTMLFYQNFGNPTELEARALASIINSGSGSNLKPGDKELWCGYELRVASWYKARKLPLVCSHIVFGGIRIAPHGYSLNYNNATFNILEDVSTTVNKRGQKLLVEIGSKYTPLAYFKDLAANKETRGDLFRNLMTLLRLSHSHGAVFSWLNDVSNMPGAEHWLLPIYKEMHGVLVRNHYLCAALLGSFVLRKMSLQSFAAQHLTPVILQMDHIYRLPEKTVTCPQPYKHPYHKNLSQLWLFNTVKNGFKDESWSAFEDDVLFTWSLYGNSYKLKKSAKHTLFSPTHDAGRFVSYHTVCNHLTNKNFKLYHDRQTDCLIAYKDKQIYAVTGPKSRRILDAASESRGIFLIDPWGDSTKPPCKQQNEVATQLYGTLKEMSHRRKTA